MTDLPQLRAALREQPAHGYAEPDLARIIAGGTRLRRRRQVLQGAAVVAVVAVVALVAGLVAQLRPGPPGSVPAAGGGPVPPPATASPEQEHATPLGNVVTAKTLDSAGERVFYFVPVRTRTLPDTSIGLMAGHRTTSGELDGQLLANVTRGPDLAPGFRVVDGGDPGIPPVVPVFGYFVGPAVRITSTVGGRTVQAHLARWSENPDVVVFWFGLDDVPTRSVLTPPKAYAADGRNLTR